jgi:uncharacterized membrane protein YbhN (UPF0104 family)
MDTPPPLPNIKVNVKRRGFIEPRIVRTVTFTVLTICIVICVVACILAIWDFTKTDALWRTVATCVVVSGGMMAFGVINLLYGPPADTNKES